MNFVQYVVSREKEVVIRDFVSSRDASEKVVNAEKIFYDLGGDAKNWREWLLLDDNLFYCVYCLCFDVHNLSKNISLTKGIDSKQSAFRLKQHLSRHEKSNLHCICKNEYIKAISPELVICNYDERTLRNREIVKSIIRCIIFSATHGK